MTRTFDVLGPPRSQWLGRSRSEDAGRRVLQEAPKRFTFRKISEDQSADEWAWRREAWQPEPGGQMRFGASSVFLAGAIGAAPRAELWNGAAYDRASSSYREVSRFGADYPAAPSGRKI